MAKKADKAPEKAPESFSMDREFFDELIKDTEFKRADTGSVMTSRMKVTTPMIVLNCIWGGGLPLGVLSEISGPPGSGKSTFSYQCMANYQKEFPNGVCVVYDMETSMDDTRLKVLGVDTEKVLRLPSTSIENAFDNMFKMLKKLETAVEKFPDISSFQIYDSISSGGTNKQHDSIEKGGSAFNAGSMMEAPRIMKQNLANIFPYLEKYPVFIGFLNQVFTQMDMYTSKLASGGGMGLKHLAHAHISFGKTSDNFEKGFLTNTTSMVKLEKSKLSPKIVEIPCVIDVTRGGRIDEIESFFRYISSADVNLIKAGSWYTISHTIESMGEKYPNLKECKGLQAYSKFIRKDELDSELKSNPDLLRFLMIALIDFINGIYPAQTDINGEYKEKLISECRYFDKPIDETNREEVIRGVQEILGDTGEE